MKNADLQAIINKAPRWIRKSIYRCLAQELEDVTIDLPACGTDQTINQRFGGTDFGIGTLNIYASEGQILVTCGDTVLLRANQDGKY